jgi:hypothetical protein
MGKRRLYWTAGLVAFLLVLPLVLWSCYVVLGVLRGQPFFHGLSVRYWAGVVTKYRGGGPALPRDWVGRAGEWFGLSGRPAVLRRNPAAVLVLAELLKEPDPFVRYYAAQTLGWFDVAGRPAVPALLHAMDDEEFHVRSLVVQALMRIRPSSSEVMPTVLRLVERGRAQDLTPVLFIFPLWQDAPEAPDVLARLVHHPEPAVRCTAIVNIGECKYAERMMPLLRETAHDSDKLVRFRTAEVLKKLDPEAAP